MAFLGTVNNWDVYSHKDALSMERELPNKTGSELTCRYRHSEKKWIAKYRNASPGSEPIASGTFDDISSALEALGIEMPSKKEFGDLFGDYLTGCSAPEKYKDLL